MKDENLKYLYDIQEAALKIRSFVEGKVFEDYQQDELLRSGIERKFEIIGEALNRIKSDDPELLDHIHGYRSIISFRNILAHGYDAIDDRIVWGIIQEDIDSLVSDIERLIGEGNRLKGLPEGN